MVDAVSFGDRRMVPVTILEEIAYHLVCSVPLDTARHCSSTATTNDNNDDTNAPTTHSTTFRPLSPSFANLFPLLLTSKQIYKALSPGYALSYWNGFFYPMRTDLYARLCAFFLDGEAIKRRWWAGVTAGGSGPENGPPTSALTAHFLNVAKTIAFYQWSQSMYETWVEDDPPQMPSTSSTANTTTRTTPPPAQASTSRPTPAHPNPDLPMYPHHLQPTDPIYFAYHPHLLTHLLRTYLLLLEHDSKNLQQLYYVRAGEIVKYIMKRRMGEGRGANEGWPVENVLNAVMLWVVWLLAYKGRVPPGLEGVPQGRRVGLEDETPCDRGVVVAMVLPYVTCPYRYASALAPPTHYTLPLPDLRSNPIFASPITSHTAHGPFPVYYSHPVAPAISHPPAQARAPPAQPSHPRAHEPRREPVREMPDLTSEAVWERERVEARAAGGVDARVGLPVVETGVMFEGRQVGQGHNPPPPAPVPAPGPPLGLVPNLQRGTGPGPARGRGQPMPANVDLPNRAPNPPMPNPQARGMPHLPHLAQPHWPLPIAPPSRPTPTFANNHAHPASGVGVYWYSSRGLERAWAESQLGISPPCRRSFGVRNEDGEEKEEDRDAGVVLNPSYPATPSPAPSLSPLHPKIDRLENPYAPLALTLPPLTIPAKLLFLARTEVVPLEVPSVLPVDREAARRVRREREGDGGEGGVAGEREEARAGRRGNDDANARWEFEGPTQEDMREVIEFRVARVRGLGSSPAAASSTPTSAPGTNATSSPDGLSATPSAAATTRQPMVFNFDIPEATSKDYDTEWWRMIMCGSLLGDGRGGRVYSSHSEDSGCSDSEGGGSDSRMMNSPASLLNRNGRLCFEWRRGRVYERGMLNGLWQGFMCTPNDASLRFLARNRSYPLNLNEETLGLGKRPIFMRIQEHAYVRVPGAFDGPGVQIGEESRSGVGGKDRDGGGIGDKKGKRRAGDQSATRPKMKMEMDRGGGGGGGAVPVPDPRVSLKFSWEMVEVPVGDGDSSDEEFPSTPGPIASTSAAAGPGTPLTRDGGARLEKRMVQCVQPAFLDENMNNAWLPGACGTLRWEVDESSGISRYEGDGSWRDPYLVNGSPRTTSAGGGGSDASRPMGSVTLLVPPPPIPLIPGEGAAQPLQSPQPNQPPPIQQPERYTYETYGKGREGVHTRLQRAKEEGRAVKGLRARQSGSGPDASGDEGMETYFYAHPGCLKCRDRERLVEEVAAGVRRKRRAALAKAHREEVDRLRASRRSTALLVEQVFERQFGRVGLGREFVGTREVAEGRGDGWEEREVVELEIGGEDEMDVDEGEEGSEGEGGLYCSHALRDGCPHSGGSHKPSPFNLDDDDGSAASSLGGKYDNVEDLAFTSRRFEECDDGVEDVVLTGGMDRRHVEAWGPWVYYGRVRPWDGLVGIVRLGVRGGSVALGGGVLDPHEVGDKFFFYGYIHAGRTLVGNWRYAGVDAIAATMESCFVLTKRSEF